ncbi:MAG: NAD(+) diphosphatase [Aestuariivita sp.]|nr:NAD(+) diphosphatase [Aestuariivita sp.]
MKLLQTVTFGAGTLDRLAHLRADNDTLSKLIQDSRVNYLPIWRGKPLFRGQVLNELGFVTADHPLFRTEPHETRSTAFLGRDRHDTLYVAFNCSSWQPEDFDEHQLHQFYDPTEYRHPTLPDDYAFVELRKVMTCLSPTHAEVAAIGKALIGWHQTHGFCPNCGSKNKPEMAGWQRMCSSCGTRSFPRADPVAIMLVTYGSAVLLGRSFFWPKGMYSLLAGFIEPGETLEGAVRREVFEEVGVKIGSVRYLASQPWPFPASLMFGCHGEALTKDINIDRTEIEDALWITKDDLLRAFAGEIPEIKPAREGAIARDLLRYWLAGYLD